VDVEKLGKRHALVHRVCGDVWREKQMWRRIGRYGQNREVIDKPTNAANENMFLA
jgi:hypothetical protein